MVTLTSSSLQRNTAEFTAEGSALTVTVTVNGLPEQPAALTGVIVAILAVLVPNIGVMSLEHDLVGILGHGGYMLMGTLFFVAMMAMLYRLATKK